jgi:subtilisin family serine protease
MQEFLEKCDPELQMIYLNYLRIVEEGMDDGASIHPDIVDPSRVSVLMLFEGALSEIEALGVEKIWSDENGFARVYVNLAVLGDIASHPNVLGLEYGSKCELCLDTSVEKIKARGTGNVWNVNSDGNFGDNDKTGKGVIIGIIDTGIDFRHPMFYKTVGSEKKTRILRIWDQGLKIDEEENKKKPDEKKEKSPDMKWLGKNYSYGVEFKEQYINDILQSANKTEDVRHRDCVGHGTHVASIAAGGGRVTKPKSDGYEFVGVAPEAELIVVKNAYLENHPIDPNSTKLPPSNRIPDTERFQDAVKYILRVVKKEHGDRPVIINYSAGFLFGPHDGLTEIELWLSKQFDPSIPKPDYASRRAFVVAAGNLGDKTQKNHAIITIPASGSVEVPFYLDFKEKFIKFGYSRCKIEKAYLLININFWYAATSGLGVQIKPPGETNFEPNTPIVPGSIEVERFGDLVLNLEAGGYIPAYAYLIKHSSPKRAGIPATGSPQANPVKRTNIRIEISPDNSGRYKTGDYIIKLTGPHKTVIHAWCHPPKKSILSVKNETNDIKINGEYTISSPAGARNVITVVSYNNDKGEEIAASSSSGPLVDYSGANPPKPYENKPDIAAPGEKINAASSADINILGHAGRMALDIMGFNPYYKEFGGTSMAAPHVAGAIALMFEKNNKLTLDKPLTELKNNAEKVKNGLPLPVNRFGAGKIDVKATFNSIKS